MSFEIPLCDAVSGGDVLWDGYGPIIPTSDEIMRFFSNAVASVRKDIAEGFDVNLDDPATVPATLEQMVSQMWEQEWSPKTGNVQYFTSEFGLLLTDSFLRSLGGQLICRSATDFLHASSWWPAQRYEAFPFHKVYKRLTDRHGGDSLEFYFRGVKHQLKAQHQRQSQPLGRKRWKQPISATRSPPPPPPTRFEPAHHGTLRSQSRSDGRRPLLTQSTASQPRAIELHRPPPRTTAAAGPSASTGGAGPGSRMPPSRPNIAH